MESAQRLSASLLSARLGRHRIREVIRVLNAFRHHCCRHRTLPNRAVTCSWCSTPFGITAVGTIRVREGVVDEYRVLNAFRHHCCRHLQYAPVWRAVNLCSTPFGITAVGTRVTPGNSWMDYECSTPFGITAVGTR